MNIKKILIGISVTLVGIFITLKFLPNSKFSKVQDTYITKISDLSDSTYKMVLIDLGLGLGDDFGISIKTDKVGNIYVLGVFTGIGTFHTLEKESMGKKDIFLAKYDVKGVFQWVQSMGGINDDEGKSIDIDSVGNIYITGFYDEFATFGNIKISGKSQEVFLAKCNSLGIFQWVKTAGGDRYDSGYSVALDKLGNVYVTGSFMGSIKFDTLSLSEKTSNFPTIDIFVAKYNNSGVIQWVQSVGGDGIDRPQKIAIDNVGDVCITGNFTKKALFGNITKASEGTINVFILKYNAFGKLKWVQTTEAISNTSTHCNATVLDKYGNIYITGDFDALTTFGDKTINSNGGQDIFVAKCNNAGKWQWVESIGGNQKYESGNAITLDEKQNIYVAGYFEGTCSFGKEKKTCKGQNDIFISKFNSLGKIDNTQTVGGEMADYVLDITVAQNKKMYITGDVHTKGSSSPNSQVNSDMFLIELQF